MSNTSRLPLTAVFFFNLVNLVILCSGCPGTTPPTDGGEADAGALPVNADGGSGDAGANSDDAGANRDDAGANSGDGGANSGDGGATGDCAPGAASLVCSDSATLSLCTEDTDFDGQSDGPPTTIEISCSAFFRNVGEASCEPFDDTTTEALCTMNDDGPCGVFTVTGQASVIRCTTDDAICLLDLDIGNYACTPNSGIVCPATGQDFVPFCSGDLAVWRCLDDGDGTGQPHVDDCPALGGGTCNPDNGNCVGIQAGGVCNLTEWHCDTGLTCQSDVCVAD